MDLRDILTRLVPTLSTAQEAGCHHADLGPRAIQWAETVSRQAMREGRDAVDATTALIALGGAEDFEQQQLGLTASILLCDDLLALVASNAPPEFEPCAPERTLREVAVDIEARTRIACNALTIPLDDRRAMFEAGVELERIVAREISGGSRRAEDAGIARIVHEQIAEVVTCRIHKRDDHANQALNAITLLAA